MTKAEIALQLTLKVFEISNGFVSVYNTDETEEGIMKNARNLSVFYNTLMEELNTSDKE